MIQLQDTVERTICKVRGVERQPAAQVLVNPSAGLEEIFTLQTERKIGEIFSKGGMQPLQHNRGMSVHVQACTLCRPGQKQQEQMYPTKKKKKSLFN